VYADLSFPGNTLDHLQGLSLIFIGFHGEPENEINDGSYPEFAAPINGNLHIPDRVPSSKGYKNLITP
jgi:hypothetical protein